MTRDSYTHSRTTGISDGTAEGLRGADDYKASQRHLARFAAGHQNLQAGNARVAEESRKLGETLVAIVAALFLHPFFCFVGFWIVCFGLLLALAPVLGLSDGDLNGLPEWYGWSAAVFSVVLVVALRKVIPTLMKWLFFGAIAVLAILLVIGVVLAN
ncbi:hypothetical protein AAFN88_18235 [Pelagibius sp. CAU 1746]|uniref:hypothetical protein n=1 Tax=Pelagibius sp. CAU 1746 TaxID=3140370 RepID=UPI00325BE06A